MESPYRRPIIEKSHISHSFQDIVVDYLFSLSQSTAVLDF